MENKFKVRICRMFPNSCKSRDDVVEKSPFLSRSASMPAAPLRKPLPRPSSICKPRMPPLLPMNSTRIISSKEVDSFVPLTHKNRASPRELKSKPKPKSHVSPVKHYIPSYDRGGTRYYAVEDDYGKKKKKRNKEKALPSFPDHDFFYGDDEKEEDDNEEEEEDRGWTTDTLFSSRSLSSSESSENRRIMRSKSMPRQSHRKTEIGEVQKGVLGSFAVVKKSRDPYGDFRKSMVEMITERRIFEEEELEQLLLCFLSLNSSHHHKVILHVFNEIRDALH